MTSLETILSSVKEMKEKHVNFKRRMVSVKPFDFSSLKLDYSLATCIFVVNHYLGVSSCHDVGSLIDDRFGLSIGDFHRFSTLDRNKVIDLIINSAREQKAGNSFFNQVFHQNYIREKDRLKAVTLGKRDYIVSDESENEIFEIYLEIFRLLLEAYFGLVSKSEFHFSFLPLSLKIYETKETKLFHDSSYNFFTRLFNDAERDTRNKLRKLLYHWYQEKKMDFIESNLELTLAQFKNYLFLLNTEQKKSIFKRFQDEVEQSHEFCKEEAKTLSEFNHHHYTQLRRIEEISYDLLEIWEMIEK